tara:strand:- start:5031 stop:7367 length:2337 start_codon:yes stop_codon:yes gene_type:complete
MSDEKSISFNEQGYLIWSHFIKGSKKNQGSKLGQGKSSNSGITCHKVIGNYTNVDFVSKVIKKENIDVYRNLMDLETRKLTSLVPEVKLFKIKDRRYIPFYFPVAAENATITSLLQPGASVGGVGIKSFSYQFIGKDFFTRDKQIECSLELFVDSIENVFKTPPPGFATLAELFTISRSQNVPLRGSMSKEVSSEQVNKPSSHEIGAFIGYSAPNTEDLLTQSERRAVENTSISLRMTYINHNLNVAQDGTATIKVDYIGRLSGILDDPMYNIIAAPEEILALADIQKEVDEAKRNAKVNDAKRKETEEKIKSIIKKKVSDNFISVMETLRREKKLYEEPIRLIDAKTYNQYVGRQEDPSLGVLKPKSLSEKPLDPEADAKLAAPGSIISTDLVTNYVYMGDFIQAVIFSTKQSLERAKKNLEKQRQEGSLGANKVNAKLKPIQNSLDNLESFKILFGKVAIVTGETSAIQVNLADIPVSVKTISDFVFKNIEQKFSSRKTLKSFLEEVVGQLYPMATTKHLYKDAKTLPSNISVKAVGITGERTAVLSAGNSEVSISKLPNFLKNFNQRRRKKDDIDYMIIYSEVSSNRNSGLAGDIKKDAEKGVYHFNLSKDRGMVKTINFSLNNVRFRKEALMLESVDLYDELKMPYNATIEMVGNNLFLPGSMIYINPSSIGFGDPRNKRSAAARLGLGGYYIVISVNTAFTAGQMVTKLETQHHSWADNDSRLSTTEMLQETGIYQTAVRNVETGNTTSLGDASPISVTGTKKFFSNPKEYFR